MGDEKKPLLSDQAMEEMQAKPGDDRWRQLILDAGGNVYLLLGNGLYDSVDGREDGGTGEMVLTDSGDKGWRARLHFVRTSATGLTAQGEVNGNPVSVEFTREDIGKNRLAERPRWISDGRRW